MNEKKPEFRPGEDGYRHPTDEILEIIQEWEFTDVQSIWDWMLFCRGCWSDTDYFTQHGNYFCIDAAGENTTFGDLATIDAMKKNKYMWHQCWLEHGMDYYIFGIPGENGLNSKRLMNITAYGPVIHHYVGITGSLSAFVNWDELLQEILYHTSLDAVIGKIGPGKILDRIDVEFIEKYLKLKKINKENKK